MNANTNANTATATATAALEWAATGMNVGLGRETVVARAKAALQDPRAIARVGQALAAVAYPTQVTLVIILEALEDRQRALAYADLLESFEDSCISTEFPDMIRLLWA